MSKNSKIRISFVGAGNVAHHLALNFHKQGVTIEQIYNRSRESGLALCNKVNAEYIGSLKELRPVDLLIIAINDNSIKSVSESIDKAISVDTIIVHTSGSQPMSILDRHEQIGVFYPLQSFRKALPLDISTVPILLSAESEMINQKLMEIGLIISEKVSRISDADRSLLHLPAVMVNNFTNHLLQLAYEYCGSHDLDFTLLHPLIKETVSRLEHDLTPSQMQTGPALRGDKATLNRHRKQLDAYPNILSLYQFMTTQIENYYK